ncbi:MAG: tyrosine--tRNA ligase [Bacteroidia bacterium]|nr:tyrosine--tRNA ligase [Bacteroidia bacterium]
MNFIEELRWRGMVHNLVPGTEEMLAKGMATGYIGFDPTAPSLGIGNLVTIMMLVHFQRCGHKPLALVGGATGMVGDPSGKASERPILSLEELRFNQEKARAQLEHFLDFDCGENSAEMVNNYDWFSQFSLLDFLRDVGKHITVNYMQAKDSVKTRMDTGISYTEFTYQLIQGYDYYHLHKEYGCQLQMGGSDQWGNITTGTELIRRLGGGEAFAVTTPLLTKADGSKFGKSESGNVWLDPKMTTPYAFYQFWLNAGDEEVVKSIKIFSTKTREEIESMIVDHEANPGARILQKALAEEITVRVHGEAALKRAQTASSLMFSKNPEDLNEVSFEDLQEILKGVPSGKVDASALEAGIPILDFLVETGAFPSKSEARRMIQQGGLKINLAAWDSFDAQINHSNLFDGKLIWIKKGKKHDHIVYLQ